METCVGVHTNIKIKIHKKKKKKTVVINSRTTVGHGYNCLYRNTPYTIILYYTAVCTGMHM